jgi:hypothetical protein
VTWSQKTISRKVNSHDLPDQGVRPSSPAQHLCSISKSSIITKHHQTWDFRPLIPHKQNPHTEINQLPVTAKIISQPDIQLCIISIVVSWQTDCHGLHERHSVLIGTQIIIVNARHPARKCVRVLQQRTLPTVCMQSKNVAVRLHTGNGSDISNDCAKPTYKKLQLRHKLHFAIHDIRSWFHTGPCSFRMTFLIPWKPNMRPEKTASGTAPTVPDPPWKNWVQLQY